MRGWARVDSWLYEPAPAERLAVLRILVGAFSTIYLAVRLPVFLALADRRGQLDPVGLLWWITDPLPTVLVVVWTIATLVLGVAFTAGLGARATGPGFAIGMLLAATYRSAWGQILWLENLMVLQLLIVACAPSADAWTIGRRGAARSRAPSASYGWPIRLAALVTVTTYVLAGVTKLRISGIDWMLGDTLRNHIAYSAARLELFGEASSPLGRAVVPLGGWLRPLAVATVAIELAAPVALLGGRIRTIWVVLAWTMHAAIAVLMIVVFPFPLVGVAFACFYRLERLPSAIRRLTSSWSAAASAG
ncbi:hypothetical protein ACE2AJ_20605 [Aquihabitans daechungensis]|uniref:hypothetical protein n=1 Tax=Aquihabitans daechungensis TaxID=1052257 RepID=UPI003B9F255B